MQKSLFKGYWLIVTIGIALLVPFFVLSFFTFPAADDLCVGSYVFENGLFQAQKIIFQEVNSRIASGFFVSVFVSNGLTIYRMAVFFIMLSFIASATFLLQTIFESIKKALLGGIAFLLISLNIFPDIAEMVYWISGAVNYFLPASLLLILTALLIKSLKNQKFTFINTFTISCLLIIVAGFHEMAVIFAVAVIMYILLFFKTTARIKLNILLMICIAILSFFLIHFTGASITRINYYEFAGYQNIFNKSIVSFIKLMTLIFSSFPFLLALFAVFLFTDRKKDIQFLNKKRFLISLLFMLLFFLCLIALPVVATSMVPPLRVYSFLCCLLIPALLFHAYIYRIHYFPQLKISFIQRFFLGRILAVIFIVSLLGGFYKVPGGEFLFTGNVSAAIHDLVFEAKPYADEMYKRIETIEHSSSNQKDSIVLPQIQHRPETLYFLDITDENPGWIRYCFQEYYEYDGVIVLKDAD